MGNGMRDHPYLVRLADCLGVPLTKKASGIVSGTGKVFVDVGLGDQALQLHVVSSKVQDDFVVLAVQIAGDLHVVAAMGPSTKGDPMMLVIDESELSFSMQGIFEHTQPREFNGVRNFLSKGIKAQYRQELGRWKQEAVSS